MSAEVPRSITTEITGPNFVENFKTRPNQVEIAPNFTYISTRILWTYPQKIFLKSSKLGHEKGFFSSSNCGFHSISREWSSIGARGKSVEAWPRHVFHGSWHRRSDHNMFQNLSSQDYQEKPKRGRLEEFWVLEPRALKLASRKDLNKFQGSKDSRGLKNVSKDQPNKQHENLQKGHENHKKGKTGEGKRWTRDFRGQLDWLTKRSSLQDQV